MTGVFLPPNFDDPLHDDSRATEVPVLVPPDSDDRWCQPPFGKLLVEFYFIEVLVEPDGNDGRPDVLDRTEHIGLVPEDRMGDRFKGCHHPETVVLGDYRAGFMPDICIPRNDYPELVTQFFRFLEIIEVPRMKDIKGSGGNDPACSHAITSRSCGVPSAVKHFQSDSR